MSDNDPRDDAMRELEAAIGAFGALCHARVDASKALADALALIRSKLPQPTYPSQPGEVGISPVDSGSGAENTDAGGWGEDDDRHRQNEEHERAVEAWRRDAICDPTRGGSYALTMGAIDEAMRLMRARPVSGKDEAAGELLRAAQTASMRMSCCHMEDDADALDAAIAKAERAGIKP